MAIIPKMGVPIGKERNSKSLRDSFFWVKSGRREKIQKKLRTENTEKIK
jgi:hypothetical protein